MHLTELFQSKQFVITCEVTCPKGIDIEEFMDTADLLKDSVSAINVGDNQRAVMRAGSLALCHLLKTGNIEPVMELSALYRNRLAFQSDLLSAAIMGIENVLVLMGDDPASGDHAEAKPVHDLDPVSIVSAAMALTKGKDMTGHDLNSTPSFCIGVVTNVEREAEGVSLTEIKDQVAQGAHYIQTPPVYQPEVLEKFMESISSLNVPVIVGHTILKSASMASFMNSNFPGVHIPENIIRELEGLPKSQLVEKSLQISTDLLKKIKPLCQGIHFVPAGWERYVPRIVQEIS
ncbi:methylenetetrahydrofolate reductase [Chloroflexota bacterium]